MDNDNKIAKKNQDKDAGQIHKEVMLFLGNELEQIHHSSSNQAYDIEKEYEKTKKNHSPFSALMLIGSFIIVITITFFVTKIINIQNQEISVSLDEFDDLNLKSLLNTVASAQANYDNAVKNRAQIEGDMTVKLKAAEDTRSNDLFVIESMNLRSKKQRDERIKQVELTYRETLAQIHQEFDGQLAQSNKEVEEYKKQLAEFDSAKIQAAQEKEKALDSERRVKELEQKKIKEQYESRISELNKNLSTLQQKSNEDMRQAVGVVSAQYKAEIDLLDPKLKDAKADKIISTNKTTAPSAFDGNSILAEKNITSKNVTDAVNEYQAIYNDYSYLDKAVEAVPQKNSIPQYVNASHSLVNKMSSMFVDTTVSLNSQIEELSSELEESKQSIINQSNYYQVTYENLMSLAKTNAILIFAEDYDKMPVYVAGKARYLITETGADAEFKVDKATIKGKIMRAEDDTFYFAVGEDKNGNLQQVDFSAVVPGTTIKILSK